MQAGPGIRGPQTFQLQVSERLVENRGRRTFGRKNPLSRRTTNNFTQSTLRLEQERRSLLGSDLRSTKRRDKHDFVSQRGRFASQRRKVRGSHRRSRRCGRVHSNHHRHLRRQSSRRRGEHNQPGKTPLSHVHAEGPSSTSHQPCR